MIAMVKLVEGGRRPQPQYICSYKGEHRRTGKELCGKSTITEDHGCSQMKAKNV